MSKVVLITGASSGIGLCAAKRFVSEGCTVYAGARRVERMEELRSMGVHTMPLDVTDELSCRSCIDAILAQEGRLDILVNNAGYGEYGPMEAVSLDRARAQLEVNLFGAMRMAQLAAPHMREQHSGRILNIGSAGGRVTTYLGGWYHAGKYALESVSDSMRMELRRFGVDVVLIEPGGVRSAWGAITAERLESAGKGTVYESDCDTVAAVYRRMYRENSRMLTSCDRAARVIVRAATAKRPRARYLFGFGARSLVFWHAALPDRVFDTLMKRMYTSKLSEMIKQ